MFSLHVGLCIVYMVGTHEGQKMASEPLELELQTGVSQHTGSGNWTEILQQGSKCSQALSPRSEF